VIAAILGLGAAGALLLGKARASREGAREIGAAERGPHTTIGSTLTPEVSDAWRANNSGMGALDSGTLGGGSTSRTIESATATGGGLSAAPSMEGGALRF
jgi:hypothetical protein